MKGESDDWGLNVEGEGWINRCGVSVSHLCIASRWVQKPSSRLPVSSFLVKCLVFVGQKIIFSNFINILGMFCLYACAPHASLVAQGDQKRWSHPLEPELQMLVRHHVTAGNRTPALEEQLVLLTTEPPLCFVLR